MSLAIEVTRRDLNAGELRAAARQASDTRQARRILSIAMVFEGHPRALAAQAGAMDRQTLRDWVHAFNVRGPDGLVNGKAPGAKPKLSPAQRAEIVAIVEAGPDPETDRVVRWRCVDLRRLILARYAIDLDEVSIGRLLKTEGYSHISARPLHPAQKPGVIEDFKKNSTSGWLKR